MTCRSLVLFIIVVACARDHDNAVFDPSATLLDIANEVCATPRQTLAQYLADRNLHDMMRDSTLKANPALDSVLSRLDSTLAAYVDEGLIFDDHDLIERFAAENKPPQYVTVSLQQLAPTSAFTNSGWIDLYYGPLGVDSSTSWGRRHGSGELYFHLQIFLLSRNTGWRTESPHYYASWISERNSAAKGLLRILREGRGCGGITGPTVH